MRIDEAESDDEAPHPALRTVAGEVCEEKTAVCLFVLPKWFTDATGAGLFQVQIGLGRAPNTPQPVALHWWDRLFEWFEAATAFAADSKWHLWTLKSPNPGGGEVSPDASNLLHIGGEIALESDVPELASPLGAIPLQITSDFGQRPPDPFNPSASKYHPAVDFRAKDPLFVYPVLSGTVTEAKTGTFQAECPDKKHLSTPLKQVKVLSNNQLEVTYKHLSEIITQSAGALIGKSGNSGACFFHLDVRMQFKDEFNTRAAIDPWPLISNNVKKFVQSTGDPVTPDCQGCRELFPFDFAVYVTEGKFTNPGVFLPFQGLEGNYSNFSSGQTQHVLTSAEGTIDLSKYPKEVTNGKYVVRITLCSDSIGGCRKVRDWKITPGNTNPWVGTWSGSTTSSCGAYSGPVTLTITSGGGNLLNFTSVWNGGSASFSGSYSGNTATSELGSTYALNGNTITVAYPPACQTATVTRQ
ncbi:MAG: M23 family metallopeptidase [Nitrospira sp.]|nr:MAG: hypothetical protein E8D42_14300 [Nitrospira sp.]